MPEPFAYTQGELLEQRLKRLEEWVQRIESEERAGLFSMLVELQKMKIEIDLAKKSFIRLIKILEEMEDEDEQQEVCPMS